MDTIELRKMTAAAAESIRNSRLWPNGIGINCGSAQYCYSEQSGAWFYSTETKIGSGDSPESAKANAVAR